VAGDALARPRRVHDLGAIRLVSAGLDVHAILRRSDNPRLVNRSSGWKVPWRIAACSRNPNRNRPLEIQQHANEAVELLTA
jgi:hypothetical protein